MLAHSSEPLASSYDLLMLDLDGVVYIGDDAVPGASGQIERARRAGAHVAYITNNAARPPAAVVERLAGVGVSAEPADVVTSAQAAARLLADRHGTGAFIAVLGAAGLQEALSEAGLVTTSVDDADAVGLVSGFAPDVRWRDVMAAAVRIRAGLPWVASNTDLTFPTAAGLAPGHGALVRMLREFSGVEPTVAGKPARPLLDETVRRVGGHRPLMVGDRLDTDIEGAHVAGVDSLLVMTGVTGLNELVAADQRARPTYVADSLAGLCEPQPVPEPDGAAWVLHGWSASCADALTIEGEGSIDDWWRVVATAAWHHLDDTGEVVDTRGVVPPAPGPGG